jgi:hypothetical protein
MPFSIQGNAVLSQMYNAYYTAYVENNPGCNGNDIERAFLTHINESLMEHSGCMQSYCTELQKVEKLIEEIR